MSIRKWNKESAKKYVEKGRQEKGLTYLSAKDFLRHYKKGNSILNI